MSHIMKAVNYEGLPYLATNEDKFEVRWRCPEHDCCKLRRFDTPGEAMTAARDPMACDGKPRSFISAIVEMRGAS